MIMSLIMKVVITISFFLLLLFFFHKEKVVIFINLEKLHFAYAVAFI